VSGNRAEGTRDDLGVDSAALELRQDGFEFPIADHRVAADEGDVEGLMLIDYTQYVPDQSVILVVRQLAQGDVAAASEVGRIVGIASRTAEGALTREFD